MSSWVRVTKRRPCPICGKGDWCMISADESAVICPRTPDGAERCVGEAGYLHHLDGHSFRRKRRTRSVRLNLSVPSSPDFGVMAAEYRQAVQPDSLNALAVDLGVSAGSLQRLGIGWIGWAWTFPMKDGTGHVRGIRLRRPDGGKLSVRRSHEGLFIPENLDGLDGPDGSSGGTGTLLISEGVSDCAALLDMDFLAVGRPSCTGGTRLLMELVQAWQVKHVIVVSDLDEHEQGQRGAAALANALVCYVPTVQIIYPPPGMKDVRQWSQRGATKADMAAAINAAEVRRLSVRIGNRQHGRD